MNIGAVFTDILLEIISKTSGFSLDIISDDNDPGLYDVIGIMNLNGKKSGTLFVSANEQSARTLCSYMIGIPMEEVTDEDINDTICEIANMLAGNAKLRFCGTDDMFMLSSPFVIKGKDMSILTKQRINVISRVVGNDEITLKFKVVY